MSKEKLKFKATAQMDEDSKEIRSIAKKRGIQLPSSSIAVFRTTYAHIEKANKNGVILARKAVEEALPSLIGTQTNFEHLGAGFVNGSILDAWIAEDDSIQVVFSFFKGLFPEEFEEAKSLMEKGELAVSFELLADRDSQEIMANGDRRLHKVEFTGMGFLMDNPPADPEAKVVEFAKRTKERLANIEDKELVCATELEKECDKVLSEHEDGDLFIITTVRDDHFHVAMVDRDGNGETVELHGTNDDPHVHRIVDWQIQESNDHAHGSLDTLFAEEARKHREKDKRKRKRRSKNKPEDEKSQGGNDDMTEEQKKKVEALREELGEVAEEVSDEDLLKEEKVEELRKAKEEEEAKKSDLEKAEEKIKSLEKKVEELEKTIEAKESEKAEVRENAEKIGQRKSELKDNPYTEDFSDEDYLDDKKVDFARRQKELDDKEAELQKKEEELEKNKKKESADHDEDCDCDECKKKETASLETGEDSEDEDEMVQKYLDKKYAQVRKETK